MILVDGFMHTDELKVARRESITSDALPLLASTCSEPLPSWIAPSRTFFWQLVNQISTYVKSRAVQAERSALPLASYGIS